MQVKVTNKDMNTITYGYDPEHYEAVLEFYRDAVDNGEIVDFEVVS